MKNLITTSSSLDSRSKIATFLKAHHVLGMMSSCAQMKASLILSIRYQQECIHNLQLGALRPLLSLFSFLASSDHNLRVLLLSLRHLLARLVFRR